MAAGHGKRMLPLTKSTPKPLLRLGDHSLIEYHLYRLCKLGFREIVINLAYLGHKIQEQLGNGEQYGVKIVYSDETPTGALETAGGLAHALPLINSDPFLVINSDIWTDYPFTKILRPLSGTARLVMVNNPGHNKKGDFSFDQSGLLLEHSNTEPENSSSNSHTFSGIGLYRKAMFDNLTAGPHALAPLLFELARSKELEGEIYSGVWTDIGTPQRLEEVSDQISN